MRLAPLSDRPREIAINLNPALTATVLWQSVAAYIDSPDNPQKSGMPFPMLFLVLPLALREASREAMPPSRSTRLQMWLSEHGEILHGFSERARWLIPFTREGLIFGASRGVFAFPADGAVGTGSSRVREPASGDPAKPLFSAAKLVGRWFAQVTDPSAVFQTLGVKP